MRCGVATATAVDPRGAAGKTPGPIDMRDFAVLPCEWLVERRRSSNHAATSGNQPIPEGAIAMEHHCLRRRVRPAIATICFGLLLCGLPAVTAFAEGPSTVQGPSGDPACFRPWGKNTTYVQWKKKPGPFRIALANGFIGNTWRIQMIKTAKAFADQPAIKSKLKEFKVISTGEDLPAQIAAANNLIDAGYDAVIVNALNPTAFAPVAKKAKKAGVVLLSFDNVIESPDNIVINVDQVELGRLAAKWLLKEIKADGGKLLEVRGPSG